MEQVRNLLIGIQSFEVLRTEGYLYVDKFESVIRRAYEKTGKRVVVLVDISHVYDYASLCGYTLGLPNDEVRYGFMKFLLPYTLDSRKKSRSGILQGKTEFESIYY